GPARRRAAGASAPRRMSRRRPRRERRSRRSDPRGRRDDRGADAVSGCATGIALYDGTARDAAAVVVSRYSTSFGLACRLLGARVRPHVRNLYALVRVADEIVDGPAAAAGLSPEAIRDLLDALETETRVAVARGFSANLVVHAFAATARECG